MATMPTNGNVNHSEQPAASAGETPSKDEVGWYFVEQYYTTLSKSTDQVHLFYGKQSQFVYGLEAEVANVSVGRSQIKDRIKALDLQDYKVRITNVDSQASDDNIVIQVIGVTVNKGGEPKKFVQTFVLAKQPSGYFVLNDILRYINDDDDAEDDSAEPAADEAVAPAAEATPEPEAAPVEEPAATEEPVPAQVDAAAVSKKLEEASTDSKETFTPAVATPAESSVRTEEPAAAPVQVESVVEASPDPEKAAQEVADEEVKKPEVPKDPSPTPVAPRPAAPAPAEPEKPKGPPKPMTWASRIAAAAVPVARAPVAVPKPVNPAAAPAPKPAAPVAAPVVAEAKPAAPAPAADAAAAPKESASEWQMADSKRQNRPQSVVGQPQEKEGTLGYVKYVTEKVKTENLKAALSAFGELVYFDINRTKNCAFVEFATAAGYQAAAAANPHIVDGENIHVEARRPKAGAYGGSGYNPRGGISGRGRGGFDSNRSGSQGGRGGFNSNPRGGRGGASRGRGVSQPTNA